MASPRTNLLAPSIEPKNSASLPTSTRRRRASFSSIRPAFRSASMAICLPGMASSVKRAPTSAMRSAPLVTTTKLMTTRIAKTIRPTAKLPPMRKWPNDSMTRPAAPAPVWPCSSTTRVEATLSERRSSVVMRITAGKAEKSSGRTIAAAISITISARAMLKVNSRSSANGGSGSTIIASTMTMNTGAPSERAAAACEPSHFCSGCIAFTGGRRRTDDARRRLGNSAGKGRQPWRTTDGGRPTAGQRHCSARGLGGERRKAAGKPAFMAGAACRTTARRAQGMAAAAMAARSCRPYVPVPGCSFDLEPTRPDPAAHARNQAAAAADRAGSSSGGTSGAARSAGIGAWPFIAMRSW